MHGGLELEWCLYEHVPHLTEQDDDVDDSGNDDIGKLQH